MKAKKTASSKLCFNLAKADCPFFTFTKWTTLYRDEHYYHKTEKNSQLCLVMYSFIPLRKCKTITNGDW